jgi:hypothetical protein
VLQLPLPLSLLPTEPAPDFLNNLRLNFYIEKGLDIAAPRTPYKL